MFLLLLLLLLPFSWKYLKFSVLFAESALYSRHAGLRTGCGDRGLTAEECKEAIEVFRYGDQNFGVRHVQSGVFPNRPHGCFVEQRSRKAYFNRLQGQAASNQDISICFVGS